MPVITRAVFPVAGMGTRFLPVTKASPKEMLPVVDKPVVQYAVEEAYEAGIRQMIFVTGRNKRVIEDHFDVSYELEAELAAQDRGELIDIVTSVKPDDMECVYIRQPKALGLGHAVLCAESLVRGAPFAVLLADDLMIGTPNTMKQMVDLFSDHRCSIVAVEDVPLEHTSRYGIVEGTPYAPRLMRMTSIVEKPHPEQTPSTLAVSGRYIFTDSIFDYIRTQTRGTGGEIQLTDGIASLLHQESVLAYRYHGHRYDCGSKMGLLQASIDLALAHHELGAALRLWLKKRLGDEEAVS